MGFTPEATLAHVAGVPWAPGHYVRLFWVCSAGQARDTFAAALYHVGEQGDVVIGLPLRDVLFTNANALMSDANRFFEKHRTPLEALKSLSPRRLTVIVVAQSELRLIQGASPILLPDWFPVAAGRETHFDFADLGTRAEVLLNGQEVRVEHIAELTFRLETALVSRLKRQLGTNRVAVTAFLSKIFGKVVDAAATLNDGEAHLATVADPRGYRPAAKKGSSSIISVLLRTITHSSAFDLPKIAEQLANAIVLPPAYRLKPVLSTLLFRMPSPMSDETASAHAMMLGVLAAYQTQNAAAHPGEYGAYSATLVYHSSIDLRRLLQDATAALGAP